MASTGKGKVGFTCTCPIVPWRILGFPNTSSRPIAPRILAMTSQEKDLSEILSKYQISVNSQPLPLTHGQKWRLESLPTSFFVDVQLLHTWAPTKATSIRYQRYKYVCLEQLTGFPACSAFASFASVATFTVPNNLGYTLRLGPHIKTEEWQV